MKNTAKRVHIGGNIVCNIKSSVCTSNFNVWKKMKQM